MSNRKRRDNWIDDAAIKLTIGILKYMKKVLVFIFSLIPCFEVIAAPPPQPVVKYSENCPTGYSVSGRSYCSPSKNARFAIVRIGSSCPSGYITSSGNYCLATSDNSKTAIQKEGNSCPNGYMTSASNYCLSNK